MGDYSSANFLWPLVSGFAGSEGRLALPYQRIGMFNMVQELAYAPEGKRIYSLSQLVCSFLLSSYREEGNSLSIHPLDSSFLLQA